MALRSGSVLFLAGLAGAQKAPAARAVSDGRDAPTEALASEGAARAPSLGAGPVLEGAVWWVSALAGGVLCDELLVQRLLSRLLRRPLPLPSLHLLDGTAADPPALQAPGSGAPPAPEAAQAVVPAPAAGKPAARSRWATVFAPLATVAVLATARRERRRQTHGPQVAVRFCSSAQFTKPLVVASMAAEKVCVPSSARPSEEAVSEQSTLYAESHGETEDLEAKFHRPPGPQQGQKQQAAEEQTSDDQRCSSAGSATVDEARPASTDVPNVLQEESVPNDNPPAAYATEPLAIAGDHDHDPEPATRSSELRDLSSFNERPAVVPRLDFTWAGAGTSLTKSASAPSPSTTSSPRIVSPRSPHLRKPGVAKRRVLSASGLSSDRSPTYGQQTGYVRHRTMEFEKKIVEFEKKTEFHRMWSEGSVCQPTDSESSDTEGSHDEARAKRLEDIVADSPTHYYRISSDA